MSKIYYGLYQTLNNNLPEKKLTQPQQKKLLSKLYNLDEEQTEAVFMLVVEHARLNDEFDIQDLDDAQLPYGIKKVNNNLEIDLTSIPDPLKWIIWKFTDVVCK